MELAAIPGVSADARNLWDYVFRAMDDEGVSKLIQRRVKDRVLYGNPDGPHARHQRYVDEVVEQSLTGSKVPADILERMEAVRKQSGTG